MSNEKDNREQEQNPAEVPAADDAPTADTKPSEPSEGSLELEPEAGREASAEVDPDLDLHLRGEDAEPIEHDFGEPDEGDVLEPPDEPPTDDLGPPDDVPPYEPEAYDYDAPRAPLHHRLMRRPEGKVIAGVCSGLGAYTNTDPVLWRIGFVIFGLTSIGVLAYIVAWLVMPEARRGEPLPDRPPHEAAQITRWAALAAIILGCYVIFKGFFHIGGGWFWGLLLIGIGFAVWGRDFVGGRGPTRPPFDRPPFERPPPVRPERWTAHSRSASPADRATPEQYATPAPPANPATSSTSGASAWPGPRQGNTAPTRPMPPTRPPRYTAPYRASRRREPSYLGRLVVGACALAIGLGLVLNNTGAIDLTAKGLLGVLVGIIGLGLLVGAWAGRARWLIFPGIGLCFALLLASWAPAFARGGFGQIVWQPQTRKELLPKYEHGAGEAVLDLTEVSFNETPREVEVDLTFGQLLVVVPEDVPVAVTTHVQGGEINNFSSNTEGWDVGNNWSEGGDEDIGLLTIDAEVGFGELTVRRERPGDDFTPGLTNGRRGRFGLDLDRIGRNS